MPRKQQQASGQPRPPKVEVKPLSAFTPDQANPMQHGDRNRAKVRNSLKQWGPGRSIVVDGKDVVYAGNCTIGEAPEAGITEVLVVEPQPHQIVAVRRPDWTPAEARGYSIADNKTSQEAEWDAKTLSQHFTAMPEEYREATGFEKWEIDPLVNADWTPRAPSGGDGESGSKEFVTFKATRDQGEVISDAIARLREVESEEEISDGRALELICAEYLAGAPLPQPIEDDVEEKAGDE